MTPTLNHRVLSRQQLAAASALADAGSNALALIHLRLAEDHALLALTAAGVADPLRAGERRDRAAIATADSDGFGHVQALIDAYLAEPRPLPRAAVPLYGGPRGAINARGAESLVRALRRLVTALRH
jgi:hypothetical protein